MPVAEISMTHFVATDDGFIVAFATSSEGRIELLRELHGLAPWQRSWLPREHAWWIADDAIAHLARRLPPLADALHQWHQRPYTVADAVADALAQAARAAREKAQGAAYRYTIVPRDVAAAYRVLGLAPGLPADEVAAARRRLARRNHPDAGGSHASMAAINSAADCIMLWLARQA